MDKFLLLTKLAFKFLKKYFSCYIKEILKLVGLFILGLLPFIILAISPILGIFLCLFISIPLTAYSFYKGILVTYSLNFLAYDFLKQQGLKTMENALAEVKSVEIDYVWYLLFVSIVSILLYTPSILIFINSINPWLNSIDLNSAMMNISTTGKLDDLHLEYFNKTGFWTIINSIFAAPFFSLCFQAFFYKKKDESFFNLFLNCYKILDLKGIIIVLIAFFLNYISQTKLAILLPILFPILTVYLTGLLLFYYQTRLKKLSKN